MKILSILSRRVKLLYTRNGIILLVLLLICQSQTILHVNSLPIQSTQIYRYYDHSFFSHGTIPMITSHHILSKSSITIRPSIRYFGYYSCNGFHALSVTRGRSSDENYNEVIDDYDETNNNMNNEYMTDYEDGNDFYDDDDDGDNNNGEVEKEMKELHFSSSTNNNTNFTIPDLTLDRKQKQKRRKLKQPRRPSSFWADINNIESELRKFWSRINVPIAADKPPPIPNEALLNHFERNDLRYAIANMGGRDAVSVRLDGAKLIPGKWTQAVTTCKEVQYLLHPSNPAGKGLSEDVPPIAPYIKRTLQKQRLDMKKKQLKSKTLKKKRQQKSVDKNVEVQTYINDDIDSLDNNSSENNVDDEDIYVDEDVIDDPIEKLRFMGGHRWAHSSARNPRGHWSQDVIIQELYQYLSHVKEEKGRPSVWMPRPSELATEGRNDLRQAMVRFGGPDKTCQLAKLVPYQDWRYFESTLELYVELLKYLVKYHDGSEKTFPKLADIQANGHQRLYDLIMEYGGRKIIASRLNMEFQAQTKLDLFKDMSFGPFSLDFAVRLMSFIRNDLMAKEPPLDKPCILMPTRQYLLERGEQRLFDDIAKYGGHESIARRLNLVFDDDEATREATKMLLEE